MPTGPLHYRTTNVAWEVKECRCMIGADHFDDGTVPSDDLDDDSGDGMSVWDAADIWASKGKDPDYTFGFSEDELQQAHDED
ncbi:hypothetical protein GCM10022239_11630 [Leifsonia bigeumensis]|uniref:Uncharacterized protein n=2 Tax=Leifsonella bigeumensis TaxID=433643 RepID=A0ABP7FH74_9MICO